MPLSLSPNAVIVVRTVLNIVIALFDLFPGVGETVSWAADLSKVIARLSKAAKAKAALSPSWHWLAKLDLTPDVSLTTALSSEALELISLGTLPTHAIETLLQIRHDIRRLRSKRS